MQLDLMSRKNFFEFQQQKNCQNYLPFQSPNPQKLVLGNTAIEQEEQFTFKQDNTYKMEYQSNIFSSEYKQTNQTPYFSMQNSQKTNNNILTNTNNNYNNLFNQVNDNIFNNQQQTNNNVFQQQNQQYNHQNNNNQMEVMDNIDYNNCSDNNNQQNCEEDEKQLEERKLLRQCITDMMQKRTDNCRSKKRKDLLNLHRNQIIDSTVDVLFQDVHFYTNEEIEYQISLYVDRLLQEQEEKDQMNYEMDQELQRAEEEYYRNQILQFQQEQEYEEYQGEMNEMQDQQFQ